MNEQERNPPRSADDQQRFAHQRCAMVKFQMAPRGIDDPRVLEAMSTVPREEFVPDAFRGEAYGDHPLPIRSGQTISQPFTVAFMAQAALLSGPEKVLEIGTGSGYGAAVLSQLAAEIHTLERIPELASESARRLKRLGYTNITVHFANGTLGLPDYAPFDAILVTASAAELPAPYRAQLAEGGRIVIPVGDGITQFMFRFTKHGGEFTTENLGRFAFVPLIGEYGWNDAQARAAW